ncbi:MAG: hypothetical protein IJ540_06990 [Prevotella sp.]|nr:hypothetical protein [Prevotella sp.]
MTLSGDGNTRTFTMPAKNVTVTATFAKDQYTLSSSATNGTVTMKYTNSEGETIASGTNIDWGTTVYVSAAPTSSDYYFTSLKYDDTDVAIGGTFEMPKANTTVAAVYTAKTNLSTAEDVVITLSSNSFTYTGSAQAPTVTKVQVGSTELVLDTDYTVDAIAQQTDVSDSYTVSVTGKGIYMGQKTTTWAITPANASVTAPPAAVASNLTYTGEPQALVTAGEASNGTLKYFVNATGTAPTTETDGWTETVPQKTDAGTYYVWYYVEASGNYSSTAVTAIEGGSKAITPATISSVAITGITAPEKDVALDVAAACATTGITSTTPAVTWKVGDTEKTGQAEANKDYTAYVTLTADANYQFVADPLATGTINGETATVTRTDASNIIVSYTFPTTGKIAINPSVSLTGWTYGSAANTPTVEGNTGNGEVTYQYKLASAAEDAYTTFNNEHYPTAVGEYNIKANIAANGDYAAGSAVNTFTIAQAAGTVSFTTATPEKAWSATAAENTYTQAATVTGDAVPSYALSNNTCGATIEGTVVTFTQAGSVTVTATVVDTENYTYATKTASYTLTVTKAALSTLSVNITGWAWGEYNSTTNAPQVAGNEGSGAETIEYKVQTADDNTYVTQIPIDAGNYTVRVSVAETDNYQSGSATANFTIAAATSYSVTLPAASNGNSITATKTSNAHVGDEITLTITTASTYLLKSIYGDHGIELSEVLNQPTKRKFTMPAADVTITATWEEKTAENAKTQITEEVKIEGDNAEITKVDLESTTTTVTISSSVGGKTVTSIDADAFSGLTNEQKANLQCVDLSSTGIVLTMVRDAANSPIRDLDANTLVYLPEGSTMDGQNVIIKDGANYNCSQFVMTDTKSYGIPHAFTATNAFLIRDFTNGQTCTVCLPFSVPAADIPGKIYRYTSISGNQITMTEDTDGLDANVPYILVPNGNDNIHRSGGGITVQITGATTVNDNFTFKGIYEDHTFTAEEISKGVYGFAGNNAVGATPGHFAKAATGAYIKGMRAYLEYTGSSTDPGLDGPDVPATARGLSDEDLPETLNIVLVNADGSTTSIGKLELIEIDDDTPRYNLNGQRVGKDYKGIVIINGKKVFIK